MRVRGLVSFLFALTSCSNGTITTPNGETPGGGDAGGAANVPGDLAHGGGLAAGGVHIGPFTDPDGNAALTSITAIAGGAANQVFVGYYGYESADAFADTEAQKQLGNADDVVANGNALAITRLLFRCDYEPGAG